MHDLLLCVGGTSPFRHVAVWINGAQENRLKLIHASVGKQQCWIIGWNC